MESKTHKITAFRKKKSIRSHSNDDELPYVQNNILITIKAQQPQWKEGSRQIRKSKKEKPAKHNSMKINIKYEELPHAQSNKHAF